MIFFERTSAILFFSRARFHREKYLVARACAVQTICLVPKQTHIRPENTARNDGRGKNLFRAALPAILFPIDSPTPRGVRFPQKARTSLRIVISLWFSIKSTAAATLFNTICRQYTRQLYYTVYLPFRLYPTSEPGSATLIRFPSPLPSTPRSHIPFLILSRVSSSLTIISSIFRLVPFSPHPCTVSISTFPLVFPLILYPLL